MDVSPASSRVATSASTLHAPSVQGSSEDDVEEEEIDENGLLNGSGDFAAQPKKKGEPKSAPTGYVLGTLREFTLFHEDK